MHSLYLQDLTVNNEIGTVENFRGLLIGLGKTRAEKQKNEKRTKI
jgi:hypothetical protein